MSSRLVPAASPQRAEDLEDLRLHGHVERRGRLVGDDQRGLAEQGHGDHHALAHPAGELVGIGAHPLARRGHAHPLQHLGGAAPGFAAGRPAVCHQHLGELLAHAQVGVERGHRVLEDHRDPVAAHRLQPRLRGAHEILSVEEDAAAGDAPRLRHEAQQREAGHALARARLAHHAEDLAAIDRERDLVHGAHEVALGGEIDA